VIAAAALGEIMHPSQVAGIVLVLAAIVVVQRSDRQSAHPMPLVEPME
jgi:drug/metabolite transporter (DMT)-like permease